MSVLHWPTRTPRRCIRGIVRVHEIVLSFSDIQAWSASWFVIVTARLIRYEWSGRRRSRITGAILRQLIVHRHVPLASGPTHDVIVVNGNGCRG